MNYYLKPIEQFVSIYLNHKDTFIERVDDSLLMQSIFNILDAQFETIKFQISQSYYSFDEETVSTHFIQKHQRKIVFLANQISLDMSRENGSASDSRKMVQTYTISKLNHLLKYIEDEYRHCLDNSYFITTECARQKAKQYAQFLAGLSSPFYYCDSLMKIALEPLRTFIDRENHNYDHKKIKYLDRLIQELQRVQQISSNPFKTNLINALININFNNANFFYYLTRMINKQVEAKGDRQGKIMVLRLNLKQFRQKIMKNDIAFINHRHNIKDQIISWINDELDYLERTSFNTSNENQPRNMAVNQRIILDLSVEQLAVLTKIAKETGIIKNEQYRPIIDIVSGFCSTKKSSNPSVKNLSNISHTLNIENPQQIKADFIRWLKSFL